MAAAYLTISLDSNLVEIRVYVNIVVKRMLRCTGCVYEVTEVSNQYVSKDCVYYSQFAFFDIHFNSQYMTFEL